MAITNATRLSDFAAGIGTEGAILQIDNANQRIGIGTQLPSQMLEVAGIVTATGFRGDGSLLEGITSAGLGTAIGDSNTVEEVIYYTDDLLTVAETTTVDPPASASAAYTQYRDVKLNDNVDLIVETGDDFIPDILGFGDDTSDPNASGNGVFDEVYTGVIKNKDGLGAPAFANGLTSVGVGTFSSDVSIGGTLSVTGNVSVGGTLTYEDVKNVDSVGLITARTGIKVTSGNVDISTGSLAVGLNSPSLKLHIQDGALPSAPAPNSNCDVVIEGTTNTGIQFLSGGQTQLRFGDADSNAAGSIIYKHSGDNFRLNFSNSGYLSLNDGGGENLRFTPNNEIGIAGANYGTSGQVLTSGGAGAAVQWADAGGGAWEVVSTHVLSGSTSYIDSNGWSNAYQRYKLVMDDIYYGGTNFRIYFRVYQDSTSGNTGTLKTASQYAYGSMDGQEAWGGMSGVPRQGTFGDYFKTAYNSWITVCNMAEYQFGMQTNVSHGSTYPYWHGTMNRNANIHLADNGIYNTDKTEFLTGIRLFFMDGSNNGITPSQGRVTILRMKYS